MIQFNHRVTGKKSDVAAASESCQQPLGKLGGRTHLSHLVLTLLPLDTLIIVLKETLENPVELYINSQPRKTSSKYTASSHRISKIFHEEVGN